MDGWTDSHLIGDAGAGRVCTDEPGQERKHANLTRVINARTARVARMRNHGEFEQRAQRDIDKAFDVQKETPCRPRYEDALAWMRDGIKGNNVDDHALHTRAPTGRPDRF